MLIPKAGVSRSTEGEGWSQLSDLNRRPTVYKYVTALRDKRRNLHDNRMDSTSNSIYRGFTLSSEKRIVTHVSCCKLLQTFMGAFWRDGMDAPTSRRPPGKSGCNACQCTARAIVTPGNEAGHGWRESLHELTPARPTSAGLAISARHGAF